MKRHLILTICAAMAIGSATAVGAGSKPKGAKPTDPNRIAALYAGKTSLWDRGGSAYWGTGGAFLGLGKSGDSVGIGKWYVTTRGKMCHESTWYWDEEGTTKSGDYKGCWDFVTAPDDVVWERWQDDKRNWYRHRADKQKPGNTNKRKIRTLRAKLGV